MANDRYICPLCGIECDYQHIVDFHKDFWENKLASEYMPVDVDNFNKRFEPIGLGAIKAKDIK